MFKTEQNPAPDNDLKASGRAARAFTERNKHGEEEKKEKEKVYTREEFEKEFRYADTLVDTFLMIAPNDE